MFLKPFRCQKKFSPADIKNSLRRIFYQKNLALADIIFYTPSSFYYFVCNDKRVQTRFKRNVSGP